MPALSAHLREPDAHGRLAFHPGCPICRGERLSGNLPAQALVPHRAGAALIAGTLAFAPLGPAAALGAEPDRENHGTADLTGPAADANANFDPGGNTTDLPTEPGAPAVERDTDHGQVEAQTPDTGGPVVEDDHVPAGPNDGAQPAPPPAQATPPPAQAAPPPAAQPAPAPPAAPATAEQPPPPPPAPSRTATEAASSPAPRTTLKRAPRKKHKAPVQHRVPAATPTPVVAVAPAPAPAPIATPAPTTNPADPGDRAHTVRSGESLWSIADDVLGPGAAPAQIAREVHRLWELNKDRIATGDPDLLMIDTRLRLR